MIDAKRLLEQLLGALGSPEDAEGSGAVQRQRKSGRGAQGGLAGGIGDALGSVQDYARQNPLLGGALAGGLASVLFGSKGGRKLAKKVLIYGGVAAIGGLAYKAYSDYQAGPAAQGRQSVVSAAANDTPFLPPPADSPFSIANAPLGANVFALELVSAMITAAKADGHINEEERAQIMAKLSEGGLDPEEEAFLARELAAPLDIDRVVRAAMNKKEAVELYAASLLAITPDHPAERAYLDMLAARLGLEPELAKTVERTIAAATA
jgi:uncharacterized membrane protein YebE (DUF533 family)